MVSRTLSGHSTSSSIASLGGGLDTKMTNMKLLAAPAPDGSESSFKVEDYDFVVGKKQQQQQQQKNRIPLKKVAATTTTTSTPSNKPTKQRRTKPRYQSGEAVQNIANSNELSRMAATNHDFPLLIQDENCFRQQRLQQQR